MQGIITGWPPLLLLAFCQLEVPVAEDVCETAVPPATEHLQATTTGFRSLQGHAFLCKREEPYARWTREEMGPACAFVAGFVCQHLTVCISFLLRYHV